MHARRAPVLADGALRHVRRRAPGRSTFRPLARSAGTGASGNRAGARVRAYLASAYGNYGLVGEWAQDLSRNLTIVSTWHAIPFADDRTDEALTDEAYREIGERNLEEIRACDVLIAFMATGSPEATYAEIGYALALGKRVVYVHAGKRGRKRVLDTLPQVRRVDLAIERSPIAAIVNAALYGERAEV